MQKLTPFLWFDHQAEQAAQFYVSTFSKWNDAKKKSKIGSIVRYSEEAAKSVGMPKDAVMCINFKLDGQEFVGLNGGPHFKFTEAVSFVINCKTQKEVDYFWDKLCEGGSPGKCGWLKDKYGLSWQVVPTALTKLIKNKNAMKAMLKMTKIDLKILREAAKSK